MFARLIYISFILLGAGLLPGCVPESRYEALKAEYDSVVLMNATYQEESYVTDSLVAAVIASFYELRTVENMINVNTLKGELPVSNQRRIRSNIDLLSGRLQQSNEAIEQLITRLEGSDMATQRMGNTIALLRRELSEQEDRVAHVTEETMQRVRYIGGLNGSLARLKAESARLKALEAEGQARLKAVEDSLNTVYYAMGTRDDLREMKLLKNNKIMVDHAEIGYLTRADRRALHEIPMLSKSARLRSVHPQQSYRFQPDKQGYLTLEITDPRSFWTYSSVMLAEVDF